MQESGMAAVGKFVLWGKENLCLIRAQGDALALETLFFAEDVRSKDEIEDAVGGTQVQQAELELAGQVIQSLVGEWEPGDFENQYRGELRAMLEAKLAGEKITRPEPVPEAPGGDLVDGASPPQRRGRPGTAFRRLEEDERRQAQDRRRPQVGLAFAPPRKKTKAAS